MNHSPAAAVQTSSANAPTASQAAFLSRLALQLGLPVSEGPRLVAPRHIVGPSGLAGRLELHPERPAVRVQTLLPLTAAEFIGPEIELLLAVQGELLTSLGWYLGTSTEGFLQLDSMTWLDDAVEAATTLDVANGIGVTVLRALLAGFAPREPEPEPAAP